MTDINLEDYITANKDKGEKSYIMFLSGTPEYEALMELRKKDVRGGNVAKIVGQLIVNFLTTLKKK